MKHLIFTLLCWLWTGVPIMLMAQGQPELHIRKAQHPIKVDGEIDPDEWAGTTITGDFWEYFPVDSIKAQVQTEVQMTYDDEYIYIAARMHNPNDWKPKENFVTPSLRRDYRGEANDGFTVVIDPFMDNTNAFTFGVNPFGVQREGLIADGGNSQQSLSLSWDNKWVAEVAHHGCCWTAELAIPFKTLRYKEGSDTWNINFYRIDSELGERSTWTRIPRNLRIVSLAQTGKLYWDQPLGKPGSNVALIPYILGGFDRDYVENQPSNRQFNLGGDAKIGVTPGLNLDLTVNPDFSQVEVDRQVANLSRFEIFFPERRQFFLENADLFANFGSNRLRPFFSRRIGIAKDPSTGINVQNPIYGGARLSGKLDENWRLGLMSIQTAQDPEINQPSVNYSVAALQRKVFGRSNIGMILVNKQPFEGSITVDTTGALEFNRLAGIDYNLASEDGRWGGKFFAHHTFDPGKNSGAYALSGMLSFNSMRWETEGMMQAVGPNFNAETGFARRNNYQQVLSTTYINFYPKKGLINRHGPGFDFDILQTNDVGLTDFDFNLLYRISFINTASFMMRLRKQYVQLIDDFDPTNTDGPTLPGGSGYHNLLLVADYFSDFRKKLLLELSTRSGGYYNGTRLNLEGSVGYRIQPYGSINLAFSINRIRLPQPYLDADFLLIGPRLDFTFTRSLFWTTFIQYNNQIDNLNINSRLQWRFKPVSDLFLVYTDNYYPDTFEAKTRALVLKVTYWLNI